MLDWFYGFSTFWHDLLNSNFGTALVGSLAGAFGGAWAAQKIAERSKLRQELLEEIRSANAAATLAFGIINTYLGLKKQHVKNLRDEFYGQRRALEEFERGRKDGTIPPGKEFRFKADYQTLTPVAVPIVPLQNIIFEKVSASGPILMILSSLIQTIHHLDDAVRARTRVAEEWKAKHPLPMEILIPAYFGLARNDLVDERYKTAIDAIYLYTDDAIGFSRMLGQELLKHGQQKRTAFKRRFGVEAPRMNRFDISRAGRYMPPEKDFDEYRSMFVETKVPTREWFARFRTRKNESPP